MPSPADAVGIAEDQKLPFGNIGYEWNVPIEAFPDPAEMDAVPDIRIREFLMGK